MKAPKKVLGWRKKRGDFRDFGTPFQKDPAKNVEQ